MRNDFPRNGLSLLCLILAVGGCLLCGGWWPQKKYERVDQTAAPTAGAQELRVVTNRGDIIVNGADTNDCSVTATITGRALKAAEAKRLADQTLIKLATEGDDLVVKIINPDIRFAGAVDVGYNIVIPAEMNVICESSHGNIRVFKIRGDVGVRTKFGGIKADTVTGRVQLATTRGDIDCNGITSPYFAAKTRLGNIKAVFSDACPSDLAARITTSYGDIETDIPVEFAGEITAETGFGRISTDVPVLITGEIRKKKLIGKVDSGDGLVGLKTGFGSITIR